MHEKNQTLISEIVLLGFQNLHNFKIPLFSIFLVIYILTICFNVLIMGLVSFSWSLHSPMYLFIQQLSVSDLLQSTNIAPILLLTIMNEGATVLLVGCITQLLCFGGLETLQCLLLAVMSYDRYVAICIPLRYTSIMSHRVCVMLILISWLLGFIITFNTGNGICTLQFGNQNYIDHFFCDFFPLVELSYSNTFFFQIEVILFSVPVVFIPFFCITVSYMCIAYAILKIVSNTGRQKAFSTCSSHLAVVSLFYGTLIAIYVVPPKTQSKTISKALSLLYTVVIPLVNPVIYSLKSKDIKDALKQILERKCNTNLIGQL